MPHIRAGDISLYYELQGEGPKLLCISGTNGDLRRKPNIFDSPLRQRFQLLAYDQRGLGQSDKPDRPYSMAEYADDAAALLDALGWDRCAVFGVSFGGMVAQEFALRHGGRVTRLVLACTSPGGAGGASYPLHELTALTPESRARHMIPINNVQRDAAWQQANPDSYQALIETFVARSRSIDGDAASLMGARRQIEARRDHDTFDRLPQLGMPVFICGGRFDGIARPESLAGLQRQIPGARLEYFDGGHFFLLEDRRAYPAIAAFLAEP